MTRFYSFLVLLICFCVAKQSAVAQELDYVQGELLVKFKSDVEVSQFVNQLNSWRSGSKAIESHSVVVPEMDIYTITFDHNSLSEFDFIEELNSEPEVEIVQLNHLITSRSTVPDDPLFGNQWQYINTGQRPGSVVGADLDIDLAWDITTGGLTALGDTIVVCVIDDGLNPLHMDFGSNIWCNHAEIPNNNMDDDGNGYIDDVKGWDTYDNDGNPYTTSGFDDHGTPVAGIIGGKGDNGIGITGVNWDVKLMIVRGGKGTEADALESYNYPLAMRKIYNETNGQEGAFVVATNSSWGNDNLRPADAPLWCAMYDSMGVHGILSAGATKNQNQNIDVVGDLPTACASEYLMTVTNLSEFDVKISRAGYGLTTIDMGAYGENTYTAATPDTYEGFGGTSAATPHVAGTIGLLYSAPCTSLATIAKDDPAAAARLVRDAIFDGVTPNSSLDGITVTGGRLNVNDALLELLTHCGPCPDLLNLQATDAFVDGFNIAWTSNDSAIQVEIQHRSVEETSWTTTLATGSSHLLTGLELCAEYEIRVRGICANEMSNYTDIIQVRTDGCCDVPMDLQTDQISEQNIEVSWDDVTASTSYLARIRTQGNTTWESFITTNSSYNFLNLSPCSIYEIEIQTNCADSLSEFSPTITVNTPGCGGCLDLDYCEAIGGDSKDDFIQLFGFGDFENNSGNDGGFGDYTNLILPHAELDRTYTIFVKPGYTGISLNEYFNVWIDFNSDGEFSTIEKVLDLNSNDTVGVSTEITIPANAVLGATRMRVGVRFSRDPEVCDGSGEMFGEYEDYCLTIDENSGISPTGPEGINFEIYPNPVVDQLIFKTSDYSIARGQLSIIDQGGHVLGDYQIDFSQNDQKTLDVSALPSGVYIVRYFSDNQNYIFTKKVVKL